MVAVRPFRALRARPDLADRIAALPYDVMDVAEARAMAAGNDVSFLHVTRPEIDLPDDVDPYDDVVYARGRAALDAFVAAGLLVRDQAPTFSVYRQTMGEHQQTGVVGLASVEEYESGVVARHELTRPDKELDRVRHVDALGAQDEPVFLLSARHLGVASVIASVVARRPEVDVVADDGVGHTVWVVSDPGEVARLEAAFAEIPRLYVADGHHRSAAAARVRELRRRRGLGVPATPDEPGHDGFLAVVFAGDELAVLPYHRAVADLAGRTTEQVLDLLGDAFELSAADGPPTPSERHVVGVYLDRAWYRMVLRPGRVDESDPVARLDVSVLQDLVLGPVLHVTNPRTDPRLSFVGGIRGTGELERLVDSGTAAVAFALHPTSVEELVALVDAGQIMPPKSTWFEPKLRSGLVVHVLDPAEGA